MYCIELYNVTAAILASPNNRWPCWCPRSKVNPLGVETFSAVNNFFCSSKFAAGHVIETL